MRVLSDPELGVVQGYMREDNYSTGYSTAPGFLGIGAQSQLDNRYLTEDVGYSLVFLADLAGRVGVPTPTMEALITLASVVLARDFRAEARAHPGDARPRRHERQRPGRPLSAPECDPRPRVRVPPRAIDGSPPFGNS